MAENIDGTQDGTGPYNTPMPALIDNANIQEALRIYHYGSKIPPLTVDAVLPSSVAGHLKTMSGRVENLENQGIGSGYLMNEPEATPGNPIPNGYIWVDADSAAPVFTTEVVSVPSVAKYQNSAPTGTIADGSLWVDKDSTPLKMYVYDLASTTWKEIGA